MGTCVWAFRQLVELNDQTGFVECDDELAVQLLELGQVQDPRDGALALNEIDYTPRAEPRAEPEPREHHHPHHRPHYDDKEMTPTRRRR